WNIKWQPSTFDTAQINSGTAVVDAVGQSAGSVSIGTGGTLALTAGWLQVANNITVNGNFNWSGGSLSTNTATTDLVVGNGVNAAAMAMSAGLGKTLRVHNATINAQGKIDLANNSMLIAAGSQAAVRTYLANGSANGWTGKGITSSSAAAVAADNS